MVLLALAAAGCKPPEQPAVTSIVGAVLLDGTGGPPISDSVVTIENGRIRAVGPRAGLLVPAEAQKIDGTGKFLMPALIDVAARIKKDGLSILRPGDAEASWRSPAIADIVSLADATSVVDRGATACLHMIRDTDAIPPVFITRMRDLRVVFVPMLSAEHVPLSLERAQRNTRQLAEGGVLIALGSDGDIIREAESLVAAGLSPADVLVAATRNGAMALGTLAVEGTIEPGKRANVMLLSGNPAVDVRNLRSRVD